MGPSRRSRHPRRSRVNPGRRAALRALLRIDAGERGDGALEAEAPPAGRDRALAWHLLSGTLQHRAELDHIIQASASRPLRKLEPKVLAVLRLAVYELRHGRAPARAVVHQAAELTRLEASGRAVGFVNAVLRNQHKAAEPPPRVKLNHPEWLLSRWEQRYGAEKAARWAASNNRPPPLCVASSRGGQQLDALLRDEGYDPLPALAAGTPVPGLRRVEGPVGSVGELLNSQVGRMWIQDAAAAAVADLVGCQPGWRVLDACAAPGGKTFRLVSQGGEVVAVDRSAGRLKRVSHGLERLRMKAQVRQHDWQAGPLDDVSSFDAVLVDAPCSGLGTLRRHPEIRWRRQPADLARNAKRQSAILERCAQQLRPGGVLVYAVCSAEPEEGEQVVERFVDCHPHFVRDASFCSAPPQSDEDAFWAARLLRAR